MTEEKPKVTLKKLTLENFKGFERAELSLGPFTLLVGANATGKSNIRDAFRFLHGIGRGYTLAEIIGGKWNEAGYQEWQGIRGGIREFTYIPLIDSDGSWAECSFEAALDVQNGSKRSQVTYSIKANYSTFLDEILRVSEERLCCDDKTLVRADPGGLGLDVELGGFHLESPFSASRPLLSQINEIDYPIITEEIIAEEAGEDTEEIREEFENKVQEIERVAEIVLDYFKSMRFLDLNPTAMRTPATPGQTILTDRGENFSSVLRTICQDLRRKNTLIGWLRELTPMDAKDFEFPSDQIGRILVTLVEKNGQRISAYSASDGALRFLGLLAALLGPETANFYIFDELENGIFPTRLHLVLQLIEQQTNLQRKTQVVASTHSPQLLGLISEETLEHAHLLYRLDDSPGARIQRIVDIPDAQRLIEKYGLLSLFESGWFENTMHFLSVPEESSMEPVA